MADLRLGPRGPGHGTGNDAPLLVSDDSGAAFVALDMNSPMFSPSFSESEFKMNPEHKILWRTAQPEDVFVHMFAFLSPIDLARVSIVNHAWKHVSYDAGLWRYLDLSNMYTKVDDALLKQLLESGRFLELEFLSLEGCSAITTKSIAVIAEHSSHLRELRLTDCNQIQHRPQELLDLVANAPCLTKLELYRAVDDTAVAQALRNLRPTLNLGMFWYEHCAATGQMLDNSGGATCRHENQVGGERGCWGRIRGRIIYSNRFYHRGGNFPKEILYSCAAHKDEDLKDADFHSCEHCDRLFRPPSMWTELICRTCFDVENLTNKNNWTSLAPTKVGAFGFHDIMNRVLRVADRKNLPPTLRNYGYIPCRLDYKLPEPNENQPLMDEHKVPLSIFLENNRDHVSEEVHQAKKIFKRARQDLNTRALLVFDSQDNVEILCDKRIILGGRDDEDNLRLTLQAWGEGLGLLWPFMIVMALVVHFTDAFRNATATTYDGRTSYTAYLYDPAPPPGISATFALILGGAIIIFIIVAVFFFWRYREWCEQCFKKFLVADILVIFLFGTGAIFWLFCKEIGWPIDAITFSIGTWNLGCMGLISLYWSIPSIIHRFYLILLNAIFAILMIATLPQWLILSFVSLAALADIISEMKPQMRLLTAFLIPSHIELLYSTPKILYEVGGLRLRAADLMWYGLMIGIVETAVPAVTMAFIVIMASIGIIVFVSPFVGRRFRPLPVAFILTILVWLWYDDLILPYVHDYTLITYKQAVIMS